MQRLALAALIATAFTASAAAATESADRYSLTLYSSAGPAPINPEVLHGARAAVPGYAMVRHERTLPLEKGRNPVRFVDVAERIDPTTVSFESLTDPSGTSVLEQNFQFDLISQDKLLQRYIDQAVTVEQARGQSVESFSGTLLSTQGGLVLREKDGTVRLVPSHAGVKLPGLPGGLITRPTLVWDVSARRAGPHRARVSYQTAGMTWWADYNVTYAEAQGVDSCKLDLGAWVSIVNQSGASYPEAALKLVAGDVHRAAPQAAAPSRAIAKAAHEDRVAGFEEKAFFEYHLYTLGRPTSLPDNSTKQIELFPAAHGVACEKTLVYYGAQPAYAYGPNPLVDRDYGIASNRKVDVYLSFRNAADRGLGMPLPAGRVRVSKLDSADQTLEFVGEDAIDHTAQDETVRLRMGSAFDVVGERRQVDFRVDTSRRQMSEEIEVRLRNHKKQPATVIVKENLYRWTNWKVTETSHKFAKEDARTVHFPVQIAAGGESILRYTVQYSW
ncbi:MAG TPA: hypothetical protein PLZ79_07315 [Burkholderiales bacterium]|nr:hypothetical protein [Burkholderiales bacterium]